MVKTITLTSAGAHDGHSGVGDIVGGELPGEGGHGGLEPGEHAEEDPWRGDMLSGMADTESGTEAAALLSGRTVSCSFTTLLDFTTLQ